MTGNQALSPKKLKITPEVFHPNSRNILFPILPSVLFCIEYEYRFPGSGLLADKAEDPEYVKDNNLSLDVNYYIKKQILPPVERILREFGVDASFLDYDEKQKGLGDFGGSGSVLREHVATQGDRQTKKPNKSQSKLFDF